MKKSLTKAIALFCTAAVVSGMFSAAVFADDAENDEQADESVEVSEEVQVEDDSLSNGAKTIYQTDIDALGGAMPTGSYDYTVMEDLVVSATAQIDVSDTDMTLDLNGHTITYFGSGSMFILGKVNNWNIIATNVTLTINDSSNGNGLITTSAGYTGGGSDDHWISTGVGKNSGRGGCVLVENGSKLILNGGTISGFKAADEGGAVHVSNGGFFEMYGGKITNCSAKNGGGVAVHAASAGRTKVYNGTTYYIQGAAWIYGGEISGNTATELGGGIRVCRADLYLYGGVIKDNTVENGTGDFGGGGVQVLKSKNEQYLYIHGNVQIFGNHNSVEAKRANLFFNADTTFELDGDLASSSKIAFGEKNESTSVNFFKINGYNYSEDNFICDNSGYYPYYNTDNDSIRIKKSSKPVIKGYQLAVGGEIVLNAFAELGTFANSNTSVSYSYSYVKSGTTKNVEGSIPFGDLVLDSNTGYYKASIPVESACMTSDITVVVKYGTSGEATYQTTTIEEYANNVINGNYPQNAKDVAQALLIYGGYAQVKFDINTDKLPSVSGVDFANGTASYGLPALQYQPGPVLTGAFGGATLSMLSQTNVNLFFYKSAFSGAAPAMTVTYSGGASETVTAKSSGNYYVYTLKGSSGKGIPATKYSASFSYEVGELSGSYSVITYLESVKYNSSDDAMKNLAEAYYNFAVKCAAFNGGNGN